MYFEAVVVFALFSTVETLMCFECNEDNDSDCYRKQVEVECKGYEDSCFSAYYNVITTDAGVGAIEQSSWKGCREKKSCDEECSWFRKKGRDCKVSCCVENECNKHGMPKNPKSKRQHNNSNPYGYRCWLLVICLILSLFLLIFVK